MERKAGFHVQVNDDRIARDSIKQRHKERKESRKPANQNITNSVLYDMMSDILDNQEHIISMINKM